MSILTEILRDKKVEVSKRQSQVSLSALLGRVKDQPGVTSLREKLQQSETVAVIAEIKKASPSVGVIREDFEPVEIAESYVRNGAAAISVLTDEKYFSGSLEYLELVRDNVDQPLLRKDFIIEPYQIVESRAGGADAILLIVSALSKDQCKELAATAREYELDFLVEVHTTAEIEFALGEEYPLVGVNNRDLSSFTTDLTTTEKLVRIAPASTVVVSESGLGSGKDVERLSRAGVDAVLIGESLMRRPDPGEALQEFVGVTKCQR